MWEWLWLEGRYLYRECCWTKLLSLKLLDSSHCVDRFELSFRFEAVSIAVEVVVVAGKVVCRMDVVEGGERRIC